MKRRLVIAVTFLAGLFYLLEFLLPPRIGGAPDCDGAAAAVAAGPGASTIYTARRDGAAPALYLRATPGAAPSLLLGPVTSRRDDYRGLQNAEIPAADLLVYSGLGWDDRTPRILAADLRAGLWVRRPAPLIDRGRPGHWDASGIVWSSTLPPARSGDPWRVWYVGRQGNRGCVGLATSADGHAFRSGERPIIEPAAEDSIESVSTRLGAEGLTAVCAVSGPGHPAGAVLTVRLAPDGASVIDRPELVEATAWQPAAGRVGAGRRLLDLRAVPAGFSLTVAAVDGKPSAHLVDRAGAAVALLRPGRSPISTRLSDWRSGFDDLLVVVGSFAIGLGLVGLAQLHGKRVLGLRKGWQESVCFFAATISMTAFTLYDRLHPLAGNWGNAAYKLMFSGLLQPLGSAMFSLLAAFLVSAAYRAFRIRTFESGLMVAAATLVMLGQVPIGNWLTQSLPHPIQIPTVMAWVLFVANNAVVRAVNFGIFVGSLATALRIWLSMDRAAMRSFE